MRRRKFIPLLWRRGQQMADCIQERQPVRRIGVLMARAESDPPTKPNLQVFRTRIQELAGRTADNVRIDYRWNAGVVDRFERPLLNSWPSSRCQFWPMPPPSVAALKNLTNRRFTGVRTVNDLSVRASWKPDPPGGNITGFTISSSH